MKKIVGLATFVLAYAALSYGADIYKFDKGHTRVAFNVDHFVISTVEGRFNDFDGTIQYDPQDISKSSVEVHIKAKSINTDNAARDNDLRGAGFLDADKYPEIVFKSAQIEKRGNQLVAVGDFTIKDVTKRIELPFTIKGPVETFGQQRIAVHTGTTIHRHDYHVQYDNKIKDGSAVVGEDVRIDIQIEATK